MWESGGSDVRFASGYARRARAGGNGVHQSVERVERALETGRNFNAANSRQAVGNIDAATDDAPPSLPPWSRSSRRCPPYPWCPS